MNEAISKEMADLNAKYAAFLKSRPERIAALIAEEQKRLARCKAELTRLRKCKTPTFSEWLDEDMWRQRILEDLKRSVRIVNMTEGEHVIVERLGRDVLKNL